MSIRGSVYALITALIVVFTLANWSVVTQLTTLNLLVARIEAPLGVVMLLATLAVIGIDVILLQVQRIAWRREQRALRRELERQRALAESAEASRLDALHAFVASETAGLRAQLERLLQLITPPRAD